MHRKWAAGGPRPVRPFATIKASALGRDLGDDVHLEHDGDRTIATLTFWRESPPHGYPPAESSVANGLAMRHWYMKA